MTLKGIGKLVGIGLLATTLETSAATLVDPAAAEKWDTKYRIAKIVGKNTSNNPKDKALARLLGLGGKLEELQKLEKKGDDLRTELKTAEDKLKTAEVGLKTAEVGLKTAEDKGDNLDNRLKEIKEKEIKINKDLNSTKYVLNVFKKGMGR